MPAKDRVSPAELAAWPARPPPDQSGLVLRFIPGVVFALTLLTGTAHNLDFVQRYPETRACCNMGIETETYVVLGVRIAGSELPYSSQLAIETTTNPESAEVRLGRDGLGRNTRTATDLPAFFGPVITGEQRQLKFVVRLRVLPGQREPALPASALRHPSQP